MLPLSRQREYTGHTTTLQLNIFFTAVAHVDYTRFEANHGGGGNNSHRSSPSIVVLGADNVVIVSQSHDDLHNKITTVTVTVTVTMCATFGLIFYQVNVEILC